MKLLSILLMLCTAVTALAQGTIVIVGGGSEGDQGDTSSWSFHLYKELINNGDVTGDGVVNVAILATSFPSQPADAQFLPDYFQWIGTTQNIAVSAQNVEIASRSDANNSNKTAPVQAADVIFIKGGDQGEYYDLWNGTLLETHIRTVVETRNGAIGGTSAGAMSQAQYCFSGGRDLISTDVLADAHTSYLDDASDGGSGIHTNFLSFISDVVIDAHFTQRGRLGRLAGITAKAIDDSGNRNIVGIGLELNTGLVIKNGVGTVVGPGSVSFVQETGQSSLTRNPGKPLFYTNLRLDRLTAGWDWDFAQARPLTNNPPAGSFATSVTLSSSSNTGALSIDGGVETENQKFGHTGTIYPADYSRIAGSQNPYIMDAVGFTDAGNSNNRMDKHEALFHLLYDQPRDLAVLGFSNGIISRSGAEPDVLEFSGSGGGVASILISAENITHKGLSQQISNWATSGGALRAAAFAGLTLHVLSDSAATGKGFNTNTHRLVDTNGGGTPGGIAEQEPNDSRNSAHDLSNSNLPVTVTGTIANSADVDYFRIELGARQSLSVALDVPAGVDYDLFLLDSRGRTKVRSTNNGNGVDESLSYTNGRRSKTYYVLVESYSGSGGTYSLTLQ